MRVPVAVFQGRRRFAWRAVPLEDGRRAWLRFVHELRPVAGIRPTFRGRPVAYTDRLPHCDPSLRGWLRRSPVGRIWRMRRRFLGYALLWLLMVLAITELTGWLFAWPAAFGGLRLGGLAVYLPGQLLGWRGLLQPGDRWIVDAAAAACGLCAAAIAWRAWLDLTRVYRPRRFGAGRWARRADVRRSEPRFGNIQSWKVVSSRINRLRKLGIFDRDAQNLRYDRMLRPGRVNIIDLSDLENTDVRNLAIAEILRGILVFQQLAYDRAQEAGEKSLSTNVIIEEAHEFLSAKRVTRMPTLRDQLVKIAKRGRKRHLGLTFVTQSPNDLPDEVLGLVNNWIIHKIDDPIVRRLRSFVPNADDSLWTLVRGLGQGQALAGFTHMKRPIVTAMDPSPAMLRMTE